MKVSFYGGVNVIGGNKVFVEEEGQGIFIDFGKDYSGEREFYEHPYLAPRETKHLLALGLLPREFRIYREDSAQKDKVKGVVISHPHTDHMDYIRYVDQSIPILWPKPVSEIVISREYTRIDPSSEYRIANYTKTEGKKLYVHSVPFEGVIKVGAFEIRAFPVDHSVFASYAFFCKSASGKKLVYSGDFRRHGPKANLTDDFLNEIAALGPIDMLVTEATNAADASPLGEKDVLNNVLQIVSDCKQLALVGASAVDFYRLETIRQASLACEREVAIPAKVAYLLHDLKTSGIGDLPRIEDYKIFLRQKKRYSTWEEEIFQTYSSAILGADDVSARQASLVLFASFYDFNELIDIRPNPGSVYILSQSEPFNEEMEVQFDKFLRWLQEFGLPLYKVHCSGHAMPFDLKLAVQRIQPRKAFIIHSEQPAILKGLLADLKATEVLLPVRGQAYES